MDAPKLKRRRFNWVVSDYVRFALKHYYQLSARLRGQRFYCRALGGESEYNLTINCDQTLSCNCQDYNGSGHLGDLKKNTFSEVFFGPVAGRFREELAKGKIPIKSCTRCGDLLRVPKSEVKVVEDFKLAPTNGNGNGNGNGQAKPLSLGRQMFAGPTPRLPYRGMLLENTVRCNIDCIGCDRQSAARIRTSLQMDLPAISRMADIVHDLGMRSLFYLNLGEPFLSPNIGKELPLLREKNPDLYVYISTNAILLNNDAKREAALYASHIYFSIAGINDPMLKKYEHYGNFEKAYGNMKALADYRNARGLTKPVLEWKYLLFNWNDRRETINRAIEMAKEAHVDVISFWPTCNPFFGQSFRYRLGLLNNVGVKSWKGREVDLRSSSSAKLSVPEPALVH